MKRFACALLLGGFVSACGGDSRTSTPTQPTPTTTTPIIPTTPTPTVDPNLWTIDGRVVQTVANTPVPGATIVFPEGIGQTTSDAAGSFHFESTTKPTLVVNANYAVTISAAGHLTRTMALAWSKQSTVTLDVIADRLPFLLSFYRDLVRDRSATPAGFKSITRWTQVPKFYMRTVDSTGRNVEPEVLASVQDSLRKGMTTWTGSRWSIGTLELGPEERPVTSGWINVVWNRDPNAFVCGTATVGGPGRITLNIDRCGCGSVKVPPGVVVHELGHSLGFWHIPLGVGIMSPQASGSCYDEQPTAQERYHAAVAYQRPNGNNDIDDDNPRVSSFQPAALVEID